jgi:hypothetical protein
MKQRIITPAISNCAKCGAEARLEEDWDFRDTWRGVCTNGHSVGRYCGTRHRATCRWNNAQLRIAAELEGGND